MKTIKLTTLISTAILLASCTDEPDMNIAKEPTFAPERYEYRAVEIAGTNAIWGDYTWKISYDNEKMDEAIRLDAEGDTIGRIQILRLSDLRYRYQVQDYVPTIDADSIQRLDLWLAGRYGEGNYSLKDSIPRSAQTRAEILVDLYDDGRVIKQTTTSYAPRTSNGTGKEYDYTYLKTKQSAELYEYDGQGRIAVVRRIEDAYNPENTEQYTRSLYKEQYLYQGGRIGEIVNSNVPDGGNFTETVRYTVQYENDHISSINGSDGSSRLYHWADGKLESIEGSSVSYTYQWDAQGCVAGISNGTGKIQRIVYEAGNGNLYWLSPLSTSLWGMPVIR